jgi:hypothetical protein
MQTTNAAGCDDGNIIMIWKREMDASPTLEII